MVPSKADIDLCIERGERLLGGHLLEVDTRLLWVSSSNPQEGEGVVRGVVICLSVVALCLGVAPLIDGLWGKEGWPIGAFGGPLTGISSVVDWWLSAVAYLIFWLSIPLFARHIWRHRARALSMWIDEQGVAAREQFAGAPPREHSYAWSEIECFKIRHEKAVSILYVAPKNIGILSRGIELQRVRSDGTQSLNQLKERLERLRP